MPRAPPFSNSKTTYRVTDGPCGKKSIPFWADPFGYVPEQPPKPRRSGPFGRVSTWLDMDSARPAFMRHHASRVTTLKVIIPGMRAGAIRVGAESASALQYPQATAFTGLLPPCERQDPPSRHPQRSHRPASRSLVLCSAETAVSPSRPAKSRAPRTVAVKVGRRRPPKVARSGLEGREHGASLAAGRDLTGCPDLRRA